MQPLLPGDSGDTPEADAAADIDAFFVDCDVFEPIALNVTDAKTDAQIFDEIIEDAVYQVKLMRDALLCGEPIAKLVALNSARAFLAQFAAPVPVE